MAELKATRPAQTEPVQLPTWPDEVYRVLKEADVRQVGMVPDAGHSRLIRAFAQLNERQRCRLPGCASRDRSRSSQPGIA